MSRSVCAVTLLALLLTLSFAGCGGGGGAGNIVTPPAISVSVTSPSAAMEEATSQKLSATVSNDSGNSGVKWSLAPATGCGALSAASTTAVTYASSPPLSGNCSATITATAVADASKSSSATIAVTATTVAITSPAATTQLAHGAAVALTATISADGSGDGVAWTVKPATGCGTLSPAAGLATQFTAPAESALSAGPCTATVTAASAADATRSAAVQIVANPVTVSAITSTALTLPGSLSQGATGIPLQASVSYDTSGDGLVWSADPAQTCGFLAPNGANFLYANSSTWPNWQKAQANASANGAATAPVHIVVIGDSISGYGDFVYNDDFAQVMPLNGLGFTSFYAIALKEYLIGNLATFTSTGCTFTRNDNTSAQNWGPAGSRMDCTGNWSWSYAPSADYPFDTASLWYEQNPSYGSANYSIDSGASTPFSMSGSESLGLLTLPIAGGAGKTHTLAANGVGPARFYGIGAATSAHRGFVLDMLWSGSSLLSQWVTYPQFVQQFMAQDSPSLVIIRLGANDAQAGLTTPDEFAQELSSLVTSLNLPANTATLLVTNLPQGLASATPQTDDCTDAAGMGAELEAFRTQILGLMPALGSSVFDERRYWPGYSNGYTSYSPACNEGFNDDALHPSPRGFNYLAAGWTQAIFPQQANAGSVFFTPALTAGSDCQATITAASADDAARSASTTITVTPAP